jgi:hypothetical protein
MGDTGMMIPLPAYIAAVEAIRPAALSHDEIMQAMDARNQGLMPEEFVDWLSLTNYLLRSIREARQ